MFLPSKFILFIKSLVPFLSIMYFPPDAILFPSFFHINLGCGAPSGSHLIVAREIKKIRFHVDKNKTL